MICAILFFFIAPSLTFAQDPIPVEVLVSCNSQEEYREQDCQTKFEAYLKRELRNIRQIKFIDTGDRFQISFVIMEITLNGVPYSYSISYLSTIKFEGQLFASFVDHAVYLNPDLRSAAESIAARFDVDSVGFLEKVAQRYQAEISVGKQKRLSLARAIAHNPEII